MTAPKTRKVKVLKNFRDAGTGVRYKKGQSPSIEDGAIANYEAAGLVESPDADDGKPAASK